MASRSEFVACIAYITAGCQKQLGAEGVEVYYDLLGDLPASALMVAAKRVVLEHKYASFPPVAMIRQFATETLDGSVKRLSAGEAWGMAMDACGRCDVDIPGSRERHLAKLPPIVIEAINAFGFMSLYDLSRKSIETARAQFRDIFNSLDDRERKEKLMPAPVRQAIAAIGVDSRTLAEVRKVAGTIGQMAHEERP